MASLSVAAIVVSHGKPELLLQSLEALQQQSHPIEQIVVVETSEDKSSIEIARSFGFGIITPGNLRLGAAVQAGINSLAQTPGWVWLLHEDCIAEPEALNRLAVAAEISPSVAIIGPKLLELENPIQIQQMGLTATKTGRPFLLVQQEYDQGQHDRAGDTLSVSTAGMLFSLGVWQQLGGFDDSSPVLAQDLEFGAKARAAGYRVIVEASARVRHAGLSMRGQRSRQWISGSVGAALAKAHVHISTLLMPLPAVIALYLLMPLYVVASVPLNLLAKRPGRIFSQLRGWVWSWMTLSSRLRARRRFREFGSTKPLASLLATTKQVRQRRKAKFEPAPEISSQDRVRGVFESNSAWFGLLPLLITAGLLPQGAISGAGFSPLGATLKEVFGLTSVSLMPFGPGMSIPADPVNWFLSLTALINPSNPSTGFAAVLFLSPMVAYFGVWQLAKLVLKKPWLITLVSLAYTFSPQFVALPSGLSLIELLASAVLPWAVFFSVKAALAYNSARAWRWVGLAGLAFAALATLSTTSALLVALVTLYLGATRGVRFFIVIWSLLPGILLLLPWAIYLFQSGQFQLLTAPASMAALPSTPTLVDISVLGTLGAIATASWFTSPARLVAPIWLASVLAIAGSWYQPLHSTRPLLLAGILGLLLLAALALANIKGKWLPASLSSLVAVGVVGSFVVYGPLIQTDPQFTDSRVMPALVEAASQTDQGVRTLVIRTEPEIEVEYVWGAGQTLERKSSISRFTQRDSNFDSSLANLTANLLAGNAGGAMSAIDDLRVDFVLLVNDDAKAAVAMDGIEFLQPAGTSRFGALWKVAVVQTAEGAVQETDPIRPWQLAGLVGYLLLAIPTRSAVRGYRRISPGVRK